MAQQALLTVTVPGGGTFNDVLNGQTLRFVRSMGLAQIGMTAADGSTVGDITANVIIGGRAVATNYRVPIEASAGSGPLEDRDMKIRDMVKPTDEILINLSNRGTVGDIDVTVYVNLPGQSA